MGLGKAGWDFVTPVEKFCRIGGRNGLAEHIEDWCSVAEEVEEAVQLSVGAAQLAKRPETFVQVAGVALLMGGLSGGLVTFGFTQLRRRLAPQSQPLLGGNA